MSQQEPQQDKVPSFEESSLYVEDDYSEKKEDDSMMTPSTETSDVAVEEKEEKEIMVSYGSLLDQEIGQSDSRESESESGTEDTRNNVQERNIVTDGGDGDVSDDYDVDDDYDVVVDNDEESLGEILRATSSDSTFSEIPPPPPPDECSVGPDDEDVPTDEECSPQRKIRKPEAPLQESTVVSPPSSSPNRTNLSNHKTKIAARLIKAVDDSEPGNHRSPELVPLKKNYQIFRKMLKTMIKSTKSYQKATLQLSEARTKLFQDYALLSKDTPLFDHVGKLMDAESLQSIEKTGDFSLATTSEGLELQAKSVAQVAEDFGAKSLATLQQVAISHEEVNSKDYQLHVLDYATEWEQIVTSKIDKELVAVKKLQQDRLHYERKVDGLRRKVNGLESKGKEIPQPQVERLSRNEQKLKNAWETHEQRAGKLCVLIEQVTEQGWKDLYPLIKNAIKWEVNRLGRENVTYGRLPSALDAMEISFQRHAENNHVE